MNKYPMDKGYICTGTRKKNTDNRATIFWFLQSFLIFMEFLQDFFTFFGFKKCFFWLVLTFKRL